MPDHEKFESAANAGFSPACPLPFDHGAKITLAHGGGGRLTRDLIERIFVPAFAEANIDAAHDAALVGLPGGSAVAFTTDSFVVQPVEFPGGDIGALAVFGTVNDLAMRGATPTAISAAFVIEAGIETALLARIADSMRQAAARAKVNVVTGDTKVIDHRGGGNLIVTTAGIGIFAGGKPPEIGPAAIRPGDAIIVSGDVGRHGMAIMAVREGLEFDSPITSDAAPLNGLVTALMAGGIPIHAMRDLTRGGLATALYELAAAADLRMTLADGAVPVRPEVATACEILGLDVLYVANEGRFAVIVPAEAAEMALEILRGDELGEGAAVIGTVTDAPAKPPLTLRYAYGSERILDLLSGEQLPRIC